MSEAMQTTPAPASLVEAIKLIIDTTGMQSTYKIEAEQLELVAMTFAISTALQPNDLTTALKAQFNMAPESGPDDAGTCTTTTSLASDFLHNFSGVAASEAKLTKRTLAFNFLLDEETLDDTAAPHPTCVKCGKQSMAAEVSRCSRCHGPVYCSSECREADWTDRHGKLCSLSALARTTQDPDDAEGKSSEDRAVAAVAPLPPAEPLPVASMPTTRSRLQMFQNVAMSIADTLAAYSLLQTARYSSRVALFVDVQEYDSEKLLKAATAAAKAERAAAAGAAAGPGGAEAEDEAPSVVVRRVYVTAVPVYQLLLLNDQIAAAQGKQPAGGPSFTPGGQVMRLVGETPIKTGVKDARVCKTTPVLALPREFHTHALERSQMATATRSCVLGLVPHGRFPNTQQGRVAAFQSGDTLLLCFRDMESGYTASAVMQPDVPSPSYEAAARACRRYDQQAFNTIMHSDSLVIEQLANEPGPPTQSVSIVTQWRENVKADAEPAPAPGMYHF